MARAWFGACAQGFFAQSVAVDLEHSEHPRHRNVAHVEELQSLYKSF
jgi:hypothetical protein